MERLSDIKFSNNSVKVVENTDGSIKAKMKRNRKKEATATKIYV